MLVGRALVRWDFGWKDGPASTICFQQQNAEMVCRHHHTALDQPEAIGSVEALPCFVGLLLGELLPAAVGCYRCRAVLQRTQDACEDK